MVVLFYYPQQLVQSYDYTTYTGFSVLIDDRPRAYVFVIDLIDWIDLIPARCSPCRGMK